MEFNFYNIVLITAVVILILTLTYIGIQMRRKVKTTVWPPMVAACPDYWEQSLDGKGCIVPNSTEKNSGNKVSSSTQGFYIDDYGNQCIDFNNPAWKGKGDPTCAKQKWATTNGVVWDGVTNYNQTC